MIDALAFEPHFLHHIAPVWRLLPDRGTFYVEQRDPPLVQEAARLGFEATGIIGFELRTSSPPPRANPGEGPTALVASIGDMKIGRRMGYRRFVFLEHGAGQSYSGSGKVGIEASYPGGPDREDVILFLVPNHHAAERYRKAYPNTPVEVIGCPKLDTLPRKEPGPTAVAISFHWPTPTMGLPPEAGNAMDSFSGIVDRLAKRVPLIGHSHPRYRGDMERLFASGGVEYVPSFEEVCRRADVYVCDNSSTIFEFAATGRNVVLMNSRYYRKDVSHGLRFWDAATVGVQVDAVIDHNLVDLDATTERMVGAIETALADPPSLREAREAALDIAYAYRSGAAERAVAAIQAHVQEDIAA